MNNDLISRSALLESAYMTGMWNRKTQQFDLCVVDLEDVQDAPAVDAEVVRHGRYGFVGMNLMAGARCTFFGTCSDCGERIIFDPKHKNYCPNCGAKMDGEVE